jgi:uncharacterized protein (TIGR02246 family)
MAEQGGKNVLRVEKAADVPVAITSVFPDGAAVAELFTENGSFVVGDGTVLDGRSEIVAYFERLLDSTDRSGTSLKGVRSTVHFDHEWQIAPDVVVVRTRGGLIFPGERDVAPERQAVQTWVVTRRGETWLAAAYQNTRVAQR